ncbi:hypothetical protein [Altericista sp. CCNU0014]|uniref:hypothetical protein n=1 Tax=Altericista sp. CCNU0014 TaxID=3082949 RepID=UPI00385076C4
MAQAKALKVDEESFNDLAVEALNHEAHRRPAIAAHECIRSRRQAILQRTGVQTGSMDEIRELRSGEGRHFPQLPIGFESLPNCLMIIPFITAL